MAIQLQVQHNGNGFSQPWEVYAESNTFTKAMSRYLNDLRRDNEYTVRVIDTRKQPELEVGA